MPAKASAAWWCIKGTGRSSHAPAQTRFPSGLTGAPILLSTSHRPSGQAGGRAKVGRALPTPNRPHATGSLRSFLGAARRAGMRLTPAKAPGRKCEGCAAVRRIPARMVVSVTRTGRGRHYPADPSRVPVFHLAHFGTGTIDVGPAFSGRDRGRGEAAHGTCTRYLHVAARCAWPTFPRTRLSPDLPGIRPPAPDPVGPAVRVAGSRGGEYAAWIRGRG